jgi:hypothetical protein
MSAEIRARRQRHDRLVSWIVVAVAVAALLLGWMVKAAAENRTALYEAEGLRLRYPASWVRGQVQPPLLLRVEDHMAKGFATGLAVQRRPLPGTLAKPLAAAQQTLALERARQWNSYRELDVLEQVAVAGRVGTHVAFAYIETRQDPFLQNLPIVVRGEDYFFEQDGQAYVFTLTASEANYARAHQALLALVESW